MIHLMENEYIQTNYYGKIKCETNWVWRKRDKPLEYYDLFYIWDGEGQVTVGEQQFDVTRGSCLLFRPGDYTSAKHNPLRPLTLSYVHFTFLQPPELIPERYRHFTDPLEFEAILARYVRLRLTNNYGADQETRLMLKQLMIFLLRSDREELTSTPHSPLALQTSIRETANYIREHPAERLKLSQLAARAGLSDKYFSKMFTAIMGQSVQEFTIQSRLERAAFLLRFGGMQVSEVAEALGYRDVFFFSRQFKLHTGKNPSELR